MSYIYYGIIVSILPTSSMLIASLAFHSIALKVKLSPIFESTTQNLCAGLILGAVAKELFPQISITSKEYDSMLGITIGFILGICFVNYLDFFVTKFEEMILYAYSYQLQPHRSSSSNPMNYINNESTALLASYKATNQTISTRNSSDSLHLTYQSSIDQIDQLIPATVKDVTSNYDTTSVGHHSEDSSDEINDESFDSDNPILLLASQATSSPLQRDRIRMKLKDFETLLQTLEQKMNYLHTATTQNSSNSDVIISAEEEGVGVSRKWLCTAEHEMVADQLDEDSHRLEYTLDHLRRLIQGLKSNIQSEVPRVLVTDEQMNLVSRQLCILKQSTIHLQEVFGDKDHSHLHQQQRQRQGGGVMGERGYIQEELQAGEVQQKEEEEQQLSTNALIELFVHMEHMQQQINKLHRFIEGYSPIKLGRRDKTKDIPLPQSGSVIPLSLLIPVVIDCMVDGFLMGTTSVFSVRAGFILGLAGFLEMGLLGLAVAIRISKCTGSSIYVRYSALICPPLMICISSILGAYCGAAAQTHHTVYLGFISFGIVALLSLVEYTDDITYILVNELLVEARESQHGHEIQWWSAMILFLGIYLVVLMDAIC